MIKFTKKFNKKHSLFFILLSLIILAPTCQSGITQRGTYPIEIFSEMHYSYAYRNQESPRLESLANAEPFVTPNERVNDSTSVLEMDSNFTYDPKIGAELYRVNCSFCHGNKGIGDGTVAPHISYEYSYSGEFTTRRAVIYTLGFTAKTYLYGPMSKAGVIKETQADMHSDTDVTSARESRIIVIPNPTTADADDDFGFTTTINFYDDTKKYNPSTDTDE